MAQLESLSRMLIRRTEAQAIVDAARFPPIGHRSIAGPNAVSGYRRGRRRNSRPYWRRRTVVAVMIETPEAVEASDEIAAVEGIDMILLGPSDLTAEMGIHGQYENEHFHHAVESVAAACRKSRRGAGSGRDQVS